MINIYQETTEPLEAYLKKVRRYARQEYNRLRQDWRYRYAHRSHAAAEALRLAGEKYDIGYGVEGHAWDMREGFEYINMGDTYVLTVAFIGNGYGGRFYVTTFGDIVKQHEREENNE